MRKANHTHEWGISYIWERYVFMSESSLNCHWDISHVSMRHVIHMSEVSLTHQWGMSHTSARHPSHVNEVCLYEWNIIMQMSVRHLTCEWVMSYIWLRLLSHISETCYTYESGISYREASFIRQWGMSLWVKHHPNVQSVRNFTYEGDITLIVSFTIPVHWGVILPKECCLFLFCLLCKSLGLLRNSVILHLLQYNFARGLQFPK